MRVSKIKILSTTFLLLLTNLFSENLSINKKYEPKDYDRERELFKRTEEEKLKKKKSGKNLS